MTLTELKEKILTLGYRVETKGDTLFVKLPLFSSVSISSSGDTIKCIAKFGKVKRSIATWINSILFPSLLIMLWFTESSLLFIGFMAFMFLSAGLWDIYRYILTQNFINLAQHIWFELQTKT